MIRLREALTERGRETGIEYCLACGQNPFECGCLDVSFESKEEKDRRERREKERATWRLIGWTDEVSSVEGRRKSDGDLDLEFGAGDWYHDQLWGTMECGDCGWRRQKRGR